jgi:hypothetical protein
MAAFVCAEYGPPEVFQFKTGSGELSCVEIAIEEMTERTERDAKCTYWKHQAKIE